MHKTIALASGLLAATAAFTQPVPEIEWQQCLGGSGFEDTFSAAQTADGGYIIAGSTDSNNGQVTDFHGGASDFWVVKLDGGGNLQWQKALGGSATDNVGEIQQTTDGGYTVAGTTSSNNGDVSGNHGSFDYWVVKLDPLGTIQWQRTYGGGSSDACWDVQQTTDGGYVLAGNASSTDGGRVFGLAKVTRRFGERYRVFDRSDE